jgi:hypothetical protein
MKKVHSLELKKYKVFRELEFPLCSFEIKNGFNEFVIIAKNENGFAIRLNYNLISDYKILKKEIS